MAGVEAPPQYREWIDFVFGRDIDDPFAADWEFAAGTEAKSELFAATFSRSGTDLADCDEKRLSIGLQALLLGYFSDIPHDVCKASDRAKVNVINSFAPLYTDLLAKRCPPALGHLSEGEGSPLAFVTYMMWDVTPLTFLVGLRDETGNRSLLVKVLDDVLIVQPANPAIQESILHGFSHMMHAYPRHAEQIRAAIDRFLRSGPLARPELTAYALAAKAGQVQ